VAQESRFTFGLGALPILFGTRHGAVPGPVPRDVDPTVPKELGLLSLTPFQREVMIALTRDARGAGTSRER
jgi:hypothetical protein